MNTHQDHQAVPTGKAAAERCADLISARAAVREACLALREAHVHANPVESLLLLPMIREARTYEVQLDAMIETREAA